jgi:hypothetical protein
VDGFGTAHWCLAVGFGQDGGVQAAKQGRRRL